MLYEIPVAVGVTGMSAAILIPQYSKMLEQTAFSPGPSIVIAACLAGFGVFAGVNLALSCEKQNRCITHLLFWGVIAMGAGWLTGSCALSAAGTGTRIFYLAAAALPLITYLCVLLTQWDDRYCKDD